MKRLILASLSVALLFGVLALSGRPAPDGFSSSDLVIDVGTRNPWTHLRLNNNPQDFRFLIISDRTGGHRARVFSRAVQQINILQPEFVLSVGDLIEGYSDKSEVLDKEWREFQGYVSRLDMPFFYVAGNHDISNSMMARLWKQKFGRDYYHFVYRNVLFLCLDSEEPPGKGGFSQAQVDWVKQTLDNNPKVRWTIVALHRPIWTYSNLETNGWLGIEKALADRPYTVFAGHHHRYQKFVRQGRNYYQLATTGGISRMRGRRYGEFDHVVWVTMKQDGPVLANLMLDGIERDDLSPFESDEAGFVRTGLKKPQPTRGVVYFEGTPVPEGQVVFYLIDPKTEKSSRLADGLLEPDGSFVLTTYKAWDGAPDGDYLVTVQSKHTPAKYSSAATSGLRAKVAPGNNQITLELKK